MTPELSARKGATKKLPLPTLFLKLTLNDYSEGEQIGIGCQIDA